jgi:hypothetical protein
MELLLLEYLGSHSEFLHALSTGAHADTLDGLLQAAADLVGYVFISSGARTNAFRTLNDIASIVNLPPSSPSESSISHLQSLLQRRASDMKKNRNWRRATATR